MRGSIWAIAPLSIGGVLSGVGVVLVTVAALLFFGRASRRTRIAIPILAIFYGLIGPSSYIGDWPWILELAVGSPGRKRPREPFAVARGRSPAARVPSPAARRPR